MIAKLHRFERRQFAAARKRMSTFRSGPFLFLCLKSELFPSRFAVVVKKKTEKKAVNRNRYKRKVYELLRTKVLPVVDHVQVICLHQGKNMTDDPEPAINELVKHLKILKSK